MNPPEWDQKIKEAMNGKVPRFFLYAKDKSLKQVDAPNTSVTNRLIDKIQSYKFNFQKKQLGKLDYRMLMTNPDIEFGEKEHELVKLYYKHASNLGNYNIDKMDEDDTYVHLLNDLKNTLSRYGDDSYITDVLVKQLFGIRRATHKAILWDCYGNTIYENLLRNEAGKKRMCQRCGKRFAALYPHQCLCPDCASKTTKVPETPKVAICFDCGKEFVPTSLSQTRCQVCQWMYENPVFDAPSSICIECGSPFPMKQRGRGRRQTLCKRCQDYKKKSRFVKYKRRIRAVN